MFGIYGYLDNVWSIKVSGSNWMDAACKCGLRINLVYFRGK